jgi:hypothetical protein
MIRLLFMVLVILNLPYNLNLLLMAKTSKKRPPNFVDLRGPRLNSRTQLVQDVLHPRLKRRYRLGLNRLKRLGLTHLAILAIVIIGLVILGFKAFAPAPDPVPLVARQAVTFPIYYPLHSELPAGYSLDTTSFSATNQVVIYAIYGGSGQKINVSVQAKPSTAQISYFNSQIIPKHAQFTTKLGTVTMGSVGSQEIASLPTNGHSWILLNASTNINQIQLKQVIKALVQAN